MTENNQQPAYRTAILPGLGQVDVPAHLSDTEVFVRGVRARGAGNTG